MILMIILLVLTIVGAIVAVETRNLLSSIVCLGAIGFILCLIFLLVGAPDIAITQLVVEILTLLILIRATINRDITDFSGERDFVGAVTSVALLLVILIVFIKNFVELPAFGNSVIDRIQDTPASFYLENSLEKTGSSNVVGGIIFDFRAYDTFGEASVLFTSVLGVIVIVRKIALRREEDKDE